MQTEYQIDNIDLKIIEALQKDARIPFLEIARSLDVSGGTIHQRIDKLKHAGIITGSKVTVDYKRLGHTVTVLLGIHLNSAKDIHTVIEKLDKLDEVVEAYYTTGNYALIIKVVLKSIDSFHEFLIKELQTIDEIRSTESFVCLKQVINKDLGLG
jgi:Lrp/AsnC family transcriptional regulator for asnA, asnC and gidA